MSVHSPTTHPESLSPPAAAPSGRRRIGLSRRRRLAGWAYATPTAAFVAVFFVIPLLLVAQMSVSDWGLFNGDQGLNAPHNFSSAVDQRLFWPAVVLILASAAASVSETPFSLTSALTHSKPVMRS